MNREWIKPKKIEQQITEQYPGIHPVILSILSNRGLLGKLDLQEFLFPDRKLHAHDPFLFKQMNEAVDLTIAHIKRGDKIIIYGDYDADGVTSSALLYEILKLLKANVEVYIPNRVSEGYGMNLNSIKIINQNGAKLIITVDNGIRNKKEIEFAVKIGISVIVTDHHAAPQKIDDLPKCIIINPKLESETYPYKDLSGVGVASKLAEALIIKSKLEEDIKQELINRMLDLVAIGTVADCVDLGGENRVLVAAGLEVINKKRRIGINELSMIAKANDKLDAWHLGWLIGPRINAAGRLEDARLALELLTTKDENTARKLAVELDEKNQERQKITEEIVNSVEKNIKINFNDQTDKIIIAVSPNIDGGEGQWNEGVIGLAASRICNKYYLPTLIITGDDNGLKGSGRSIEKFHITQALEKTADFLEKYGGHAAACGFSISDKKSLAGFIDAIKIIAKDNLSIENIQPNLRIDSPLELSSLTEELINEIALLEPFGEGNPRPIFISENVSVVDSIKMGASGQHIKLRLKNHDSRIVNAIGFNQSERWTDLVVGDKINIAYHLDLNKFNGNSEPQMKIIDILKS